MSDEREAMDEDEAYFAIDRARMEWTLTGQIHGLNAGESVVVVPKSSREAAEAEAERWHSAWVNNANKMEAKLEAAETERDEAIRELLLARLRDSSGGER